MGSEKLCVSLLISFTASCQLDKNCFGCSGCPGILTPGFCLVSHGRGRPSAGLFGPWMAFAGLAEFQELVTSGHSCKYLFFLWEQGRCQAKQLWLLSCRSPHGKGFPMTYDPVSQDAIPFPRRAVGDLIKIMVGGWTVELAHLVKRFCGNMRTQVLVPESI